MPPIPIPLYRFFAFDASVAQVHQHQNKRVLRAGPQQPGFKLHAGAMSLVALRFPAFFCKALSYVDSPSYELKTAVEASAVGCAGVDSRRLFIAVFCVFMFVL